VLGLSFRNRCGLTPSRFAALAREAEEAGFQHLIFTERFNDLVAYLVAAAGTTRCSQLWSGVANVGLRHPILMASGAAVIDDVSRGRFTLGLGIGNEWHPGERYDTLASSPLALMREYVAVVRAALNNEIIDHPGPRFPVRGAHMSFKPLRADLPIVLAALGPRMIELGAEIADGVFVHMLGPQDLPAVRENIALGCERRQRDPNEITLAVLPILCVSDDVAAARDTVRAAIVDYLSYDAYKRHLSRLGYRTALSQIERSLGRDNLLAAARHVPDELTDRVAIYGTVETCRQRLRDYAVAGATVTILSPRPLCRMDGRDVAPQAWGRMYKYVIEQFSRRQ